MFAANAAPFRNLAKPVVAAAAVLGLGTVGLLVTTNSDTRGARARRHAKYRRRPRELLASS